MGGQAVGEDEQWEQTDEIAPMTPARWVRRRSNRRERQNWRAYLRAVGGADEPHGLFLQEPPVIQRERRDEI